MVSTSGGWLAASSSTDTVRFFRDCKFEAICIQVKGISHCRTSPQELAPAKKHIDVYWDVAQITDGLKECVWQAGNCGLHS